MAVVGIIAATLATIYENMAHIVTRANSFSDVTIAASTLQGVLNRADTCTKLVQNMNLHWTGSGAVNVPEMSIGSGVNKIVYAKTGELMGRVLKVKSIVLQPPLSTNGTTRMTTAPQSKYSSGSPPSDHYSYSAVFTITFDSPAGAQLTGGAIKSKDLLVTIGTDTTGKIVECPLDRLKLIPDMDCVTEMPKYSAYRKGLWDVCQSQNLYISTCYSRYWVIGFDSVGRVMCDCDTVCRYTP